MPSRYGRRSRCSGRLRRLRAVPTRDRRTAARAPSGSPRPARARQRLLEEDGTTFSEFLLTQRLSQAHRRLCEPDCGEIPISTIAYDCGFGDLSYFNRRFRRAYGLTPREARGEGAMLGSRVLE